MTKRYGLRGVVLSMFGVIYVCYGAALFVADKQDRFSRPGPGAQLEVMDTGWWGLLWIVIGAYAILSMFLNRYSKKWYDEFAYGLASVPPTFWSATYLVSWIEFVVTGGELGQETNYTGAVIFAALAAMLIFLGRHLPPEGVG